MLAWLSKTEPTTRSPKVAGSRAVLVRGHIRTEGGSSRTSRQPTACARETPVRIAKRLTIALAKIRHAERGAVQ